MIAAMITAANLGARPTGYGFIVFTVGSVGWASIGLATGQTNLLVTNAILTGVNLIGVWRWLGRQARYEKGARLASIASRRAAVPTLFTATAIAGRTVHDSRGERYGTAVEALVDCDGCSIVYVVVSTGGVGGVAEELRAVDRADLRFESERIMLTLDDQSFKRLPLLTGEAWPERTDPARVLSELAGPIAAHSDHA